MYLQYGFKKSKIYIEKKKKYASGISISKIGDWANALYRREATGYKCVYN